MKAAAFAFLAATLSFALPVAASAAQPDKPGEPYDQKIGAPTSVHPHEEQAQLGSDRGGNRNCPGLRQRARELQNDESRARDHGDYAHTRTQLDQINDQIRRDCAH